MTGALNFCSSHYIMKLAMSLSTTVFGLFSLTHFLKIFSDDSVITPLETSLNHVIVEEILGR